MKPQKLLPSTCLLAIMVAGSGCATTNAGKLKPPEMSAAIKALPDHKFDEHGVAAATFNYKDDLSKRGVNYILPSLPYVLPVAYKDYIGALDKYKFTTYVTSDNKPNALLYDDDREAMALTQVNKAAAVTSTQKLNAATQKPLNAMLTALKSKYDVELIYNTSGYHIETAGKRHPYTQRRYLVTYHQAPIAASKIRDELLIPMYGRFVNPQSGIETWIKNKVFYVDISTFSDLKINSGIHAVTWVHPVNFNDKSVENKWIDTHTPFVNGSAFID